MSDIADIRKDLPMSMTMAAFIGISWYIGLEINTSLFLLFKRRSGLYFWSCALASWGVILQPLFIILADFGVWDNLLGAVIMIYLTWLIMVVPQSWVMYSRLYLIMQQDRLLRLIKYVLLFTSIAFSVPTIVIGTIAQATQINPSITNFNLIWDRVQLTVFFVQETFLSLLYIYQTRKYLRDSSLLSKPESRTASKTREVLQHLIYVNVLVVGLDIALLGIQYASLFYLQGALKPCVYGIKLKVEFAILNRLIDMARSRANNDSSYGSQGSGGLFALGQSRPKLATSWVQQSQQSEQSQPRLGELNLGEDIRLSRLEGPTHARLQSYESNNPIWDGGGARTTTVTSG